MRRTVLGPCVTSYIGRLMRPREFKRGLGSTFKWSLGQRMFGNS